MQGTCGMMRNGGRRGRGGGGDDSSTGRAFLCRSRTSIRIVRITRDPGRGTSGQEHRSFSIIGSRRRTPHDPLQIREGSRCGVGVAVVLWLLEGPGIDHHLFLPTTITSRSRTSIRSWSPHRDTAIGKATRQQKGGNAFRVVVVVVVGRRRSHTSHGGQARQSGNGGRHFRGTRAVGMGGPQGFLNVPHRRSRRRRVF